MNLNFKEWLILDHTGSPGSKQLLYPKFYGGIGCYPTPMYINWSADALVYTSSDHRKLEFNWGKGILSDPNPEGTQLNFGKANDETTPDRLLVFKWGKKGTILEKPEGINFIQS